MQMDKLHNLVEGMRSNPVIAAVRKEEDVDDAIASGVSSIFLLHADIFNIKYIVDKIRKYGKNVFIHIDFLEGLGRDNKAVDYINEVINPDGIISTKSSSIKYAKEKGMFTIQRFFLVDSLSYETTIKAVQSVHPDMIEIMPGVMPKIIKRITKKVSIPVIAGGLIDNSEDISELLKAGALGASTGKKELWVL